MSRGFGIGGVGVGVGIGGGCGDERVFLDWLVYALGSLVVIGFVGGGGLAFLGCGLSACRGVSGGGVGVVGVVGGWLAWDVGWWLGEVGRMWESLVGGERDWDSRGRATRLGMWESLVGGELK